MYLLLCVYSTGLEIPGQNLRYMCSAISYSRNIRYSYFFDIFYAKFNYGIFTDTPNQSVANFLYFLNILLP